MAMDAFRSHAENKAAREEMRPGPFMIQVMRRMGIVKGAGIGEYCKSRDVLESLQFIHDNLTSAGELILPMVK